MITDFRFEVNGQIHPNDMIDLEHHEGVQPGIRGNRFWPSTVPLILQRGQNHIVTPTAGIRRPRRVRSR